LESIFYSRDIAEKISADFISQTRKGPGTYVPGPFKNRYFKEIPWHIRKTNLGHDRKILYYLSIFFRKN